VYKHFAIKNFRCFEDLTVEPLERINLIAGKNNVGKTALLEALWLHHGYHNPELGLRLRVFRGLDRFRRDEFLWDLFSGLNPEKIIELSSRDQANQTRSLHITIREHPTSRVSLRKEHPAEGIRRESLSADMIEQETTTPIESEVLLDYTDSSGKNLQAHAYVEPDGVRFERPSGVKEPSAIFLPAQQRSKLETLAERFGNLAVDKKETRIVQILRIIEPRLEDLTVQHRGGVPVIYGDIGMKRLMPLPLMGDGMGRLLGLALAIPEAHNGLLLVDEIENGLHYTVMGEVWRAIAKLAREYNAQIFAATHSEECIRAAHQAFTADEQYDFALHRLERVRGLIRAVTYDQETLEAALETGLEVR